MIKTDSINDSSDVAIKWDGNPTIYWGREPDGEFVLVGKNGWGRNKSTSADDLSRFIQNSGKGVEEQPWRKDFGEEMAEVFELMKSATPGSFRGYVYGDLLYSPRKPFTATKGAVEFEPNLVKYTVDTNGQLGGRIANSKVGVVVHTKLEEFGSKSATPFKDVQELNSNDVVVLGQTFIRDLYEAPAKRIVAVMPGGFHPFHPGHKSLYDWAVKTFGQGNVYVAATNDTAARPFPFDVKKKLAGMAGVPESNFIQVKSPFNAMSYQDIVDDTTALVFVRSEKDKAEHPKPDQTKKNGEPGYLRTYTGKDLNSSNEMGYMAYGPTINFDFSGMQIKSASELRATWPNMSDEDKHKAATLMYGNGHDEAVQLLDKALAVLMHQ